MLLRLAPDTDPRVLRAAELASLAVAQGHAALDLARPTLLLEGEDWPTPSDWANALAVSPWVCQAASHDAPTPADRPLVLEQGLLYLRRYREYERRLADGLRRLAAEPDEPAAPAPSALFAQLFPQASLDAAAGSDSDADADADGGQARAARAALAHRLLLVTGGPGTGKTTTIARLLVLRVAQAVAAGLAPPRIALAAPTGRAADRMAQSLRAAIERMAQAGVAPELLAALPRQASTLHRLLGTVPDRPRFRHDRDHPLAQEVIVVDEASMIDLPLMCKLVEAVPDGASVVLLGDPDQLPSVEAGDVLAAIVAAARPPSSHASGTDAPSRAAGCLHPDARQGDLFAPVPAMSASIPPRGPVRVHLRRGFRQSASLDLAPLTEAVRAGNGDGALRLLREGGLEGVSFHPDVFDLFDAPACASLLEDWRELAIQPDPARALALADRARVLTALRTGAQGAVQVNARIEEHLAGAHRGRYFHGRLLLITENSYRHGLFNGDTGLCLRDAHGATVAWFASGSQDVRAFHPAALPAHESAFAMTVHKAQGSEYERVWLQLPRQDVRTLSRELVYTALTRARAQVHVAGGGDVLRAALARHVQRVSGLAARLA